MLFRFSLAVGKPTVRHGGTDQSGDDPKANGEVWASTHETRWHAGSFFLIEDEHAAIADRRFETHSVLGVDPESDEYVARTFENHGFYRHYRLSTKSNVWTLSGDTERARIEFTDNHRAQVITWEWKPKDTWLPLCDRTAVKQD
jgi:hypothetical protein